MYEGEDHSRRRGASEGDGNAGRPAKGERQVVHQQHHQDDDESARVVGVGGR